jgi:hypothetical protein
MGPSRVFADRPIDGGKGAGSEPFEQRSEIWKLKQMPSASRLGKSSDQT